jgi:hypothetical protein
VLRFSERPWVCSQFDVDVDADGGEVQWAHMRQRGDACVGATVIVPAVNVRPLA